MWVVKKYAQLFFLGFTSSLESVMESLKVRAFLAFFWIKQASIYLKLVLLTNQFIIRWEIGLPLQKLNWVRLFNYPLHFAIQNFIARLKFHFEGGSAKGAFVQIFGFHILYALNTENVAAIELARLNHYFKTNRTRGFNVIQAPFIKLLPLLLLQFSRNLNIFRFEIVDNIFMNIWFSDFCEFFSGHASENA